MMLARVRDAPPLSGRDVLNALDGVVYATDLNGILTFVADAAWEEFENGNRVPGLRADVIIGASLFDMIDSDELREAYRDLHDDIVGGARARVAFTYHCDAPSTERVMRMSVTRLVVEGRAIGVLYQSQLLEEHIRPPAALWLRGSPGKSPAAPMVAFCSSCTRVAWRDPKRKAAQLAWMSVDEFRARGGPAPASPVQHLCPNCRIGLGV